MIELGLVTPDHERKPRMLHNESHKFESAFVGVRIEPNESVMLRSLAGSELGIWVAHGEGRFSLPYEESRYRIPVRYSYDRYPAIRTGATTTQRPSVRKTVAIWPSCLTWSARSGRGTGPVIPRIGPGTR